MYEDYINVEQNTELCVEISIDLIEIVHINSRIMGFNNGNEIDIKSGNESREQSQDEEEPKLEYQSSQ